tara:strand:- start:710 stop:1069 length:360 start_codon:yes stop_codon:yes gene_type:complete
MSKDDDATIHKLPHKKPRTGDFWRMLEEVAPEALLFDGPEGYAFDSAIIGVATRIGMAPVVAYDEDRLIEALVEEGWDYTDAVEWVEINTKGSYLGENTPIIINFVEDSPYTEGQHWAK